MAVIRLSSVGDIVLTEPVVAALEAAAPGVEIAYVTKRRFAGLVSAHPSVSRVHELADGSRGAMRDLIREIRDSRYSAVVDLHRNARSIEIARRSGAGLRARYRKRETIDSIRVRLLRRPFRASRLLVDRYLEALLPLGIAAPYAPPRLYVSDEGTSSGLSLLERAGLADSRFAAIVPGSVWATKRWPAEGFARVAAGLVADHGLAVALLGTEAEAELCGRVAGLAGSGVSVIAGDTSLGAAAAVISSASVFVGNDSGPTHMSMALGVPSVAIFGPTDPGQFDFSGHALVYRDPACGACTFFGGRSCRLGHWDCMARIEPSDVLGAVSALLREGGAGP